MQEILTLLEKIQDLKNQEIIVSEDEEGNYPTFHVYSEISTEIDKLISEVIEKVRWKV